MRARGNNTARKGERGGKKTWMEGGTHTGRGMEGAEKMEEVD